MLLDFMRKRSSKCFRSFDTFWYVSPLRVSGSTQGTRVIIMLSHCFSSDFGPQSLYDKTYRANKRTLNIMKLSGHHATLQLLTLHFLRCVFVLFLADRSESDNIERWIQKKMGETQKKGNKTVEEKLRQFKLHVTKRYIDKQKLEIMKRLGEWQKKGANTDWKIQARENTQGRRVTKKKTKLSNKSTR